MDPGDVALARAKLKEIYKDDPLTEQQTQRMLWMWTRKKHPSIRCYIPDPVTLLRRFNWVVSTWMYRGDYLDKIQDIVANVRDVTGKCYCMPFSDWTNTNLVADSGEVPCLPDELIEKRGFMLAGDMDRPDVLHTGGRGGVDDANYGDGADDGDDGDDGGEDDVAYDD